MATKILNIFVKIFAVCVLLATMYILSIFIFPDLADTYGNADFNTKIRELKEKSLEISKP